VKQSGEIHLVVDCSVEKITQLLKASLYTVKKRFAIFPSPAKLSLAGEKIILFPAKESLISVIPAGDGNITDLFHSVLYGITSMVALIL
jgi:hypothetical protein